MVVADLRETSWKEVQRARPVINDLERYIGAGRRSYRADGSQVPQASTKLPRGTWGNHSAELPNRPHICSKNLDFLCSKLYDQGIQPIHCKCSINHFPDPNLRTSFV